MDILAINHPYLTSPGFRDVFATAGHRTLSIGWHNEGCDIVLLKPVLSLAEIYSVLPPGFEPQRIVYFDRSEPVRVFGLETAPVPTLVHLVDTHIHRSWHPVWSGTFDGVLLAMKGYRNLLPEGPFLPPVEWFPLWAFRVGAPPDSPRSTPAAFRGSIGGTHPRRLEFFSGVNARTPIDFGTGPFFQLYNDSKIILNDCINDDLNWRVFEALASGAMLLTPRVSPETLELFPDGDSLVTYAPHDVDEATKKIDYYLSHDTERLRIARNGHARLIAGHTSEHRAHKLLKIIESLQPRSADRKLFSAAATYLKTPSTFPNFFPQLYLNAAVETIDKLGDTPSISGDERTRLIYALESLYDQAASLHAPLSPPSPPRSEA